MSGVIVSGLFPFNVREVCKNRGQLAALADVGVLQIIFEHSLIKEVGNVIIRSQTGYKLFAVRGSMLVVKNGNNGQVSKQELFCFVQKNSLLGLPLILVGGGSNAVCIINFLNCIINSLEFFLCIVNTGGNHADLTDDYAAVPAEMKSVAALMGKQTLRQCDEADFMSRISYMRSIVGDRAIMRAMHFFNENKRVDAQKKALLEGNFEDYLKNVTASGNSSFKFLQNVYTNKNVEEQGISIALAITESFGEVCRVHGGGFAGTIQAYIPAERVGEYKATMEAVFGENACQVYTIRSFGAAAVYMDGVKD